MMSQPLLKVYGHISPADAVLYAALNDACASALVANDDVPLVELVGDLVRLSFEGAYFPVEDVVAVLEAHVRPEQEGKLDVLDLEAWKLIRYTVAQGHLERRSAPLNHVLDYAGH